jgi:hypothetical protein
MTTQKQPEPLDAFDKALIGLIAGGVLAGGGVGFAGGRESGYIEGYKAGADAGAKVTNVQGNQYIDNSIHLHIGNRAAPVTPATPDSPIDLD